MTTTSRPTRVVVLSAGLSVPSSTRLLADKLGEAVERAVSARAPWRRTAPVGRVLDMVRPHL